MVLPLGMSLETLRKSSGTFETAVGLPPEAYSDAEFHRFEMDAVFGSEWLCVGRQEQIPTVGDYLSVTRAGEPLIVAPVERRIYPGHVGGVSAPGDVPDCIG